MSSFWKEKSIPLERLMAISSFWKAALSSTVPRMENSTQARTFLSGCMMLIRPVSLLMASILSP